MQSKTLEYGIDGTSPRFKLLISILKMLSQGLNVYAGGKEHKFRIFV